MAPESFASCRELIGCEQRPVPRQQDEGFNAHIETPVLPQRRKAVGHIRTSEERSGCADATALADPSA